MYFTYILIQKKKYFNNIYKIWPCIKFHKKINKFFREWLYRWGRNFNQQVITNYTTKRPFWWVRFISLILDLRSFCILFFYSSPFMRSLNFIPDFLDLFLQCAVYHLSNTLTTLLMRRHFLFHAMTKVQVLLG